MSDKPTIEDSLLLCASDLQHSAIYDNHSEMQSCIRAVADRITALVSVIDSVERTALDALKHPAVKPDMLVNGGALKLALNALCRAGKNEVADELECTAQAGEYPELPPLQVRYDGLGHTTTMGYGASQMRDYADATCAARKATLTTPAQPLHVAAINCPHEIDKDRVVLHYDSKQPGKNALAQLAARPLTDSQIADIYFEALGQHLREQDRKTVTRFARAIEAATAPQPAARALDAREKLHLDVACAIWEVMREYEDRCDMELEDVGCSHVVWQLANAAIAAQQGTDAS